MLAGMHGNDGVLLIETKVVHGDHPRRFSGGLELPADRWASTPRVKPAGVGDM
jgi:hypothetical protein